MQEGVWLGGSHEREAKVLASLNHPNIGSIYRLEEAEGSMIGLVAFPTEDARIVSLKPGQSLGPYKVVALIRRGRDGPGLAGHRHAAQPHAGCQDRGSGVRA